MNRRTTHPTVGFDPLFVASRSPRSAQAPPDCWDGLRRILRNTTLFDGRWEGSLRSVLEATRRGGFEGHARALAYAQAHGLDTPMAFLQHWLRRSRFDWSLDEAGDRLVLLKRSPRAKLKSGKLPPEGHDGVAQGLFEPDDSP